MAKKSNASRGIGLVLLIVVAAVVAVLWMRQRKSAPADGPGSTTVVTANTPLAITPDNILPSNEGRVISLAGKLDVRTPARDTQLGVSADAVMLLRFVEMHQWYEQCGGGRCDYKKVWSPQLINSRKFHEKEGHQNPERLPLTSARFSAGEVRLGAFRIDAATIGNYRLSAALHAQPVPFPVTSAQLPTNLAISFRDSNGVLFSGSDPANPAIGDVRVSYRIIPAGDVELTGLQRGDRLMVQKATSVPTQPNR